MLNNTIVNVLSLDEIADILNDATVVSNKEKLKAQSKVDFSIQLADSMKTKLETALAMDLSKSELLPMRWIKGDTPAHTDKGREHFNNTYLVYLTDSVGELIVDGQSYPIAAGDAHIFSEGLTHSTMNTENVERLMIGPMSESGFHVGVPPFVSFTVNTMNDPSGPQGFKYSLVNYATPPYTITIFDLPPPTPVSTSEYTIEESNPVDWTPPSGKTFGGWKLMEVLPGMTNDPLVNPPTNGIYMPGTTYEFTGYTYLVPNWIDAPIAPICFAANTPIITDQGVIPIEKVNPDVNTIGTKKVVAITKTVSLDNYLVCFEKNAIWDNIPSERTVVSKDHLIYNNGQMIKADDFVGKYKNVHKIKYNGDILYNVLLETYDKILVNNLICETLHPRNAIAKLCSSLNTASLEEKCRIIKMHNDSALNSHNWRLKCKRIKTNISMKR